MSIRRTTVQIRWVDDDAQFFRNLVTAAARARGFQGVREAALWQPFQEPCAEFHRRTRRQNPRHILRLTITLVHRPGRMPEITDVRIATASSVQAIRPEQVYRPPPLPPVPSAWAVIDTDVGLQDLEAPDVPSATVMSGILTAVGGAGHVGIFVVGLVGVLAETAGAVIDIVEIGHHFVELADYSSRLAHFYGKCRGYCVAMQDMAAAFSSPRLDAISQARWPSVPHPSPHRPPHSRLLPPNDPHWLRGNAEGCQKAYQTIIGMDRVYQTPGGPFRLTGRMHLRLLAWRYGNHRHAVAEAVRHALMLRLRAHGRDLGTPQLYDEP